VRRSEIIAREVLPEGEAIGAGKQRVERNAYEVPVEDGAHPDVLAIIVRARDCDEAERVAVNWVSSMVRKGMRVSG
jgi:hypothetical protein